MAASLLIPQRPLDVVIALLVIGASFLISLSVYYLALHPYAKYPGPFLAKITSLRAAWYAYTGDIHLDIERCHQRYGKFVRYGPNSLLVYGATGYHDIYGPIKKVAKSPSYVVHGTGNLIGIRDKKDYAKKKKIFQQGFSDLALRKHEPTMIKQIDLFCKLLLEEGGRTDSSQGEWTEAKDMNSWCNYLTTDVVCNAVFSTSWDLLTSSANRGVRETIATVIRLIGVLHQSPLLYGYSYAPALVVPHLTWSVKSLRRHTKDMMARSMSLRQEDPSVDDYFGQFISAKDPETGDIALNHLDVRLNSANFIIAGSDTTSSSLAATFFYLSRHPTEYARCAAEVRAAFSSVGEIRTGPQLTGCVYLRAAINEAMRFTPVTAQPLWRRVESGGCFVDGEFIPEGCIVGAGVYSLHHDPAAWLDSFKYDPERWLVHPSGNEKQDEQERARIAEMTRYFSPFSAGPRQCIAKNFAQMELMLTMANVFYRMDFERAPGELGKIGEGRAGMGPGRERPGEFQIVSYFTSWMEGPMIRFKARADV